jgi:hypothetical protein
VQEVLDSDPVIILIIFFVAEKLIEGLLLFLPHCVNCGIIPTYNTVLFPIAINKYDGTVKDVM